jgi:type 1 glutamine amidotransferase
VKILYTYFLFGTIFLNLASGADAFKQVLFFSKSAGYEHAISYRDTAWPSFLEAEMLKLGNENHIFFTFSKDGSIFTPENIAKYDAFVFYTSGDLIHDQRDGWGDNYTMMTKEGRDALLQAIRNGKGFMGVHCAIDTFSESFTDVDHLGSSKMNAYHEMLGAEYLGHGELQAGHLIQADKSFPGMQTVPADYAPIDEWYALDNFRPDLHVVLALDCPQMKGSLYARSIYPVAWARREGRGRVFYTAAGHTAAVWHDPVFRQMILGGVQWVSGQVEADITPNFGTLTPHATEIPPSARQAITSDPTSQTRN